MAKSARILASMTALTLLVSTGGCVMRSTHQKVLATLAETEGRLQRTEANLTATEQAKADLAGQYALSQADNERLKGGLAAAVSDLEATAAKVQTADASVVKLKTASAEVSAKLSRLQQAVADQRTTITALAQAIAPLKDEVQALRAKLSALAASRPDATKPAAGKLIPPP